MELKSRLDNEYIQEVKFFRANLGIYFVFTV